MCRPQSIALRGGVRVCVCYENEDVHVCYEGEGIIRGIVGVG